MLGVPAVEGVAAAGGCGQAGQLACCVGGATCRVDRSVCAVDVEGDGVFNILPDCKELCVGGYIGGYINGCTGNDLTVRTCSPALELLARGGVKPFAGRVYSSAVVLAIILPTPSLLSNEMVLPAALKVPLMQESPLVAAVRVPPEKVTVPPLTALMP